MIMSSPVIYLLLWMLAAVISPAILEKAISNIFDSRPIRVGDYGRPPTTFTIPLYDCSLSHRTKANSTSTFQIYHNEEWYSQSCQEGLTWNQTLCRCDLPSEKARLTRCRDFRAISVKPTGKYQQFVNGRWIARDCSLAVAGLVWNPIACLCELGPRSQEIVVGKGRTTPCDIMLNMTFEDGIKDNAKNSFVDVMRGGPVPIYTLSREDSIDGTKAAFFNDTSLNVWYFSGNEIGTSLRVEFRFKMSGSPIQPDKYQMFVSNGCNITFPGYTTPTVAIGYRAADHSYLLAFETASTRKATVCTRKMNTHDWHTVSLIYEDGTLLFTVDNQPCIISQDFSGPVQKTMCPLTIGADPLERESVFQGYMDNILIARYCRNSVKTDQAEPESKTQERMSQKSATSLKSSNTERGQDSLNKGDNLTKHHYFPKITIYRSELPNFDDSLQMNTRHFQGTRSKKHIPVVRDIQTSRKKNKAKDNINNSKTSVESIDKKHYRIKNNILGNELGSNVIVDSGVNIPESASRTSNDYNDAVKTEDAKKYYIDAVKRDDARNDITDSVKTDDARNDYSDAVKTEDASNDYSDAVKTDVARNSYSDSVKIADARNDYSDTEKTDDARNGYSDTEKTEDARNSYSDSVKTADARNDYSDNEKTDDATNGYSDIVKIDEARNDYREPVKTDDARNDFSDAVKTYDARDDYSDAVKTDNTRKDYVDTVKTDDARNYYSDSIKTDDARNDYSDSIKTDDTRINVENSQKISGHFKGVTISDNSDKFESETSNTVINVITNDKFDDNKSNKKIKYTNKNYINKDFEKNIYTRADLTNKRQKNMIEETEYRDDRNVRDSDSKLKVKKTEHKKGKIIRDDSNEVTDKKIEHIKGKIIRDDSNEVTDKKTEHIKGKIIRDDSNELRDKTDGHMKGKIIRDDSNEVTNKKTEHMKGKIIRDDSNELRDKTDVHVKGKIIRDDNNELDKKTELSNAENVEHELTDKKDKYRNVQNNRKKDIEDDKFQSSEKTHDSGLRKFYRHTENDEYSDGVRAYNKDKIKVDEFVDNSNTLSDNKQIKKHIAKNYSRGNTRISNGKINATKNTGISNGKINETKNIGISNGKINATKNVGISNGKINATKNTENSKTKGKNRKIQNNKKNNKTMEVSKSFQRSRENRRDLTSNNNNRFKNITISAAEQHNDVHSNHVIKDTPLWYEFSPQKRKRPHLSGINLSQGSAFIMDRKDKTKHISYEPNINLLRGKRRNRSSKNNWYDAVSKSTGSLNSPLFSNSTNKTARKERNRSSSENVSEKRRTNTKTDMEDTMETKSKQTNKLAQKTLHTELVVQDFHGDEVVRDQLSLDRHYYDNNRVIADKASLDRRNINNDRKVNVKSSKDRRNHGGDRMITNKSSKDRRNYGKVRVVKNMPSSHRHNYNTDRVVTDKPRLDGRNHDTDMVFTDKSGSHRHNYDTDRVVTDKPSIDGQYHDTDEVLPDKSNFNPNDYDSDQVVTDQSVLDRNSYDNNKVVQAKPSVDRHNYGTGRVVKDEPVQGGHNYGTDRVVKDEPVQGGRNYGTDRVVKDEPVQGGRNYDTDRVGSDRSRLDQHNYETDRDIIDKSSLDRPEHDLIVKGKSNLNRYNYGTGRMITNKSTQDQHDYNNEQVVTDRSLPDRHGYEDDRAVTEHSSSERPSKDPKKIFSRKVITVRQEKQNGFEKASLRNPSRLDNFHDDDDDDDDDDEYDVRNVNQLHDKNRENESTFLDNSSQYKDNDEDQLPTLKQKNKTQHKRQQFITNNQQKEMSNTIKNDDNVPDEPPTFEKENNLRRSSQTFITSIQPKKHDLSNKLKDAKNVRDESQASEQEKKNDQDSSQQFISSTQQNAVVDIKSSVTIKHTYNEDHNQVYKPYNGKKYEQSLGGGVSKSPLKMPVDITKIRSSMTSI